MNCEQCQGLMQEQASRTLSQSERAALRAHMMACESCFTQWHSVSEAAPSQAASDISGRVLQAMQLDPCAAAEAYLFEGLETALDRPRQALLDQHLAACPRCLATAQQLHSLPPRLAALAELTPPAQLVADILHATVDAPAVTPAAPRRRQWPRIFLRPRFPQELALLFATAWVLAFGLPTAAFESVERSTPAVERSLDLLPQMMTNGLSAMNSARQTMMDSGQTLAEQVRMDMREGGASLRQKIRQLGTQLDASLDPTNTQQETSHE